MPIKLLFFAQSADWVGAKDMNYEMPTPTTVEKLLSRQELLALKEHLKILRIAVNQEFADGNTLVRDGDEVAFLPPVSGG